MASSYIQYKEHGFWIRDTLLECVTATFYIIVRDLEKKDEWLYDFKTLLLRNSIGHFYSHMSLELDKYFINQERRECFLSIISRAVAFYSKKGVEVDFNFMEKELEPERHYVDNNWNFKIETYRLLKILFYFELLIFEKLNIKDSDDLFYEF